MTVREERTVSASLTLHYDKLLILLQPTEAARGLARQRVTVVNYPDGRFAIRHNGLDLPFRVFDKLGQGRSSGHRREQASRRRAGPLSRTAGRL